MKRLHRSAPVRMLCLALACLAGLTACAPGGAAGAEPAPIEVPPPVEQTNEGLTVFYTDFKTPESNILDVAVAQYKEQYPIWNLTLKLTTLTGLATTKLLWTAAYMMVNA